MAVVAGALALRLGSEVMGLILGTAEVSTGQILYPGDFGEWDQITGEITDCLRTAFLLYVNRCRSGLSVPCRGYNMQSSITTIDWIILLQSDLSQLKEGSDPSGLLHAFFLPMPTPNSSPQEPTPEHLLTTR